MGQRVSQRQSKQPHPLISQPCPTCGQMRRVHNGAYLQWLREQAGLSQREMAKHLGVSGPYLSDIERNRRTVSGDIFAAYLALLET